jgi:hypothetical protein
MSKSRRSVHIPLPQPSSGSEIPAPHPAPLNLAKDKVLFSFELFDAKQECPSTWKGEELKALFSAFRKASERTWLQLFQTGGTSGTKVGLGFTKFSSDPFPRPPNLSQDVAICEIRVNDKARFFGVHIRNAFYIIRLDSNHAVCP